jgi:phosphohistidine phosphatase
MQAIFIRHGSATPAGGGGDAARTLTDAGKGEVRTTALALAAMGAKAQFILSSPLARAVETAKIVAAVHGAAEVKTAECLAPPVDAKAVASGLAEMAGQCLQAVALVGHTPSLERCIGHLIAGRAVGMSLSKAGAACVEFPPEGSSDPPELLWLLHREQLADIAGADDDP